MMLMSLLATAAGEGPHRDDNGQIVTHSWIWPEQAELIYGTTASLLIFGLLWKFAGPAIKQGFTARTARIQGELDASATALADAEAEATEIRRARGDIDAERQRLFADADVQAEAVLADGRSRLESEVADLDARADAEIQSASGRVSDELRGEITRIASAATERVLSDGGIGDSTQQDLIESFISRVGASS